MAKQIKAIKCPQCGSTSYVVSRKMGADDLYKCDSCGTEYFLDNDDININVNHRNPEPSNTNSPLLIKRILMGIGGAFLFYIIMLFIFGINKKTNKSTSSISGRSSISHTKEKNPNRFIESYRYSYVFESATGKLIVFCITERSYKESFSKDSRNGYFVTFKNLLTGEIINERKLEIEKLKDYNSRKFMDGRRYFIINKRNLYVINESGLSFDNITEETFNKQSELSSGIADMSFTYKESGNGFKIISNTGKEYYYYPLINRLYNNDQFYNARFGFKSLLPGAKEVTYFTFSGKSMYYEDEPIQLLKVVYKNNNGGPENRETSPKWFKDFGGSGIFTNRDPYVKRLFDYDDARVISYKDMTPDKLYFSAHVVYYDNQVVIVRYRPTAADDAATILQCMDANTSEILWSLDLDNDSKRLDNITLTSEGYIAKSNNSKFFIIGKDGKIKKDIPLQKEYDPK